MAKSAVSLQHAQMHGPIRIEPGTRRHKVHVQRFSLVVAPTRGIDPLSEQPLPLRVGATAQGQARALCVGPTHWLIVSDTLDVPALRKALEASVGDGYAFVNLTDGLAIVEVAGPSARDLLSKGCGIDMHPTDMTAGRCVRTRFANLPVVVDCLEDAGRFELYVARSSLAYLIAWLRDAAFEFRD